MAKLSRAVSIDAVLLYDSSSSKGQDRSLGDAVAKPVQPKWALQRKAADRPTHPWNVIEAEIIASGRAGSRVQISRVNLAPSDVNLPFVLHRTVPS